MQPAEQQPALNLNAVATDECVGCCPLTTRENLTIIGSGGALFIVILLLMRTAMVSALVRKDWSPTLASHAALSASLALGGLGTTVIADIVKGCWLSSFTLLAVVLGGVWALHLLFTLFAVRK